MESGSQTGHEHIQLYVHWSAPKALSAMKQLDSGAHWEVCASPAQALEYCMKEETRVDGPWEFGTKPVVGRPKLIGEDALKMSVEEIKRQPLHTIC